RIAPRPTEHPDEVAAAYRPLTGDASAGEVLARLRIEQVHPGTVDPERRLLALANPAGRIERDDQLRAQCLEVQLLREFVGPLADLVRRFVRQVGVLLIAEPLGDVDLRPERRAPLTLGVLDELRVIEVVR